MEIATKLHQFKAKDSAKNDYPLGSGNSSKHFTINIMKKRNLEELESFFLVFNSIDTNDILGYYK